MARIELSDARESVAFESLPEAIKAAAEWYDYLAADGGSLIGNDFPRLDSEKVFDVNGLNAAISDWEEQLASEMGFHPFRTDNGYRVRAADEAGLHLAARETEILRIYIHPDFP